MNLISSSFIILVCLQIVSSGQILMTQDAAAPDFAQDVLPILTEHCFQCHGPDAQSRQASLRLDQLHLLKNSSSNKDSIVIPNRPEKSVLIGRIKSAESETRMPPPEFEKPLSPKQIQILDDWVRSGARTSRHWAFVKPVRPDLPVVSNQDWVQNPIDRFVLAKLEANHLKPSEKADRHRLLKRLHLDLIGLLPSRETILSELNPSKVDWPDIIDRLLSDPSFGELRAQSWLDAARFADTMGHAADKPRTMWLYRDWVIDAINSDRPFDQFTIEQLAGDLLPNVDESQLIATGFHRNSIQALGNNPRKEEYRIKGIVDRLETTGKTWLGLTIGCAECHDHKYDPISQKEYYSLFAIFNNIPHQGEKFNVHGPRIETHSQKEKLLLSRMNQKIEKFEQSIQDAAFSDKQDLQFKAAFDKVLSNSTPLIKLQRPKVAFTGSAAHPKLFGYSAFESWQKQVRGEGVRIAPEGRDEHRYSLSFDGSQPIVLTGPYRPSITRSFSIAMWIKTTQPVADLVSSYDWRGNRRSILFGIGGENETKSKPGHLFLWCSQKKDSFVGVTAESSIPINDGQWHHIVVSVEAGKSVEFYIDGILDTKARMEGSVPRAIAESGLPLAIGGGYSASLIPNQYFFKGRLARIKIFDRVLSRIQLGGLNQHESKLVQAQLLLPESQRSNEFLQLRNEMRQSIPTGRAQRAAMLEEYLGLANSTSQAQVMQEMERPRQAFVFERGNFERPGERVSPAIPKIFFGENSPLGLSKKNQRQKINRLTLAKQLVSPQNPLTARVAVNRIWQHHFGHGLVKTAGDFGRRSDPPTHPKLLDWLAVELVESGWSRKNIHRLIVTSATYQQTSQASHRLRKLDPQNRLLARGPRNRVSGEQVRDIALQASGQLVQIVGGPSVYPPQPTGVGEFRDDTAGKWQEDSTENRFRKSLYTFWQRMSPYPMLTLFDLPTRERCTVQRPRTNTPLQALVTLNDLHFVELSEKLGDRIAHSAKSDSERIRNAFLYVLARPPSQLEIDRFLSFIKQTNGTPWQLIAQVLLNLDEAVSKE